MKNPHDRGRVWRTWRPVAAAADLGVAAGLPPCAGADLIRRATKPLADPFWWPEASTVRVEGTPDLFDGSVAHSLLGRTFEVMSATGWHTYLVGTAHADRLEAFARTLFWPPNVWTRVPDGPRESWRQPGGRACDGLPPLPPFRVPSPQERGWVASAFVPEAECPYPLDHALLAQELQALGDDPDAMWGCGDG